MRSFHQRAFIPFGGLVTREWHILDQSGQVIKAAAFPFVLTGDFHIPPSKLQGSEWVNGVDGICLAPSRVIHTNSSKPGGSVIDLLVVSSVLSQQATLEVLVDRGAAPQCPVAL